MPNIHTAFKAVGNLKMTKGLEKNEFTFKSQRRAETKTALRIEQLRSCLMLVSNVILNFFQNILQQFTNRELPEKNLVCGETEEIEIKLPTIAGL